MRIATLELDHPAPSCVRIGDDQRALAALVVGIVLHGILDASAWHQRLDQNPASVLLACRIAQQQQVEESPTLDYPTKYLFDLNYVVQTPE